ncbi:MULTISPECIES: ATP-binding cassette domain-containing protein [unclassified Microbacterium]|uniref:ATP-binding cassette domain-containing protein n=1 Tax=unclassified Microbacterium TaxID=2609290 RepID=UPI00214CBAF9|nr:MULTISPECIES: ATP-binding cassette domain-containing protein [unclassified Microbacterium]MCR2784617.1 ATP-binding cassette domain-containing protein [Microbacterium sp. zg.B96]MDL5353050.1 ATP-binding cassette domain-containing protein [Microbacterium sp. zg-YB36]WIM16160.1 ATP-binding cassette domain-containing protein [Microbacterium sp. zg-B96]
MTEAAPLLQVADLSISYDSGGPFRKRKNVVHGVSFDIRQGETFGLVGESGSGKSTTGRAILRLLAPSAGSITFDGTEVTGFGRTTPLSYRRDVQAVFQDPSTSLNPRQPVSRCVTLALKRHGMGDRVERERRAAEAFDHVGLTRMHLDRYPSELSGGQQQRVAIARALALGPRLVVCDEALSALDLSTQNQIISLLVELQVETGMSYLFIGHNLEIVRHISDRIAVMRLGELVEQGSARDVFDNPQHPYTRKLLGSTPAQHPAGRDERRRVRASFAQSPLAVPALEV